MKKFPLAVLILLNTPIFGLMINILFSKGDFFESIKCLFIPDFLSALRGRYWEDRWSEVKLMVFGLLCFSFVWSELSFIETHYPYLYALFQE